MRISSSLHGEIKFVHFTNVIITPPDAGQVLEETEAEDGKGKAIRVTGREGP
jgi:hypothetical protein